MSQNYQDKDVSTVLPTSASPILTSNKVNKTGNQITDGPAVYEYIKNFKYSDSTMTLSEIKSKYNIFSTSNNNILDLGDKGFKIHVKNEDAVYIDKFINTTLNVDTTIGFSFISDLQNTDPSPTPITNGNNISIALSLEDNSSNINIIPEVLYSNNISLTQDSNTPVLNNYLYTNTMYIKSIKGKLYISHDNINYIDLNKNLEGEYLITITNSLKVSGYIYISYFYVKTSN